MKKISAIVLAMLLALVCIVPAFATDTTGTITINNAKGSTTYNAYQVLDLESYNADTGAYAYKAASTQWAAFLAQDTIDGVYVDTDDDGYVTWVTDADAAAFAKLAIAYADANSIAATGTTTTAADATTAAISGLDLGYYLVDSTVGTLCSLNTTNPNATINDKNDVPSIDKKIVEGTTKVTTNTASIGDTVNYEITVSAKKGAENYVIHDTMDASLTLNASSIAVTGLTATTDYTVNTAPTDGCTFEIVFTKTYLDTITADTTITATYSATLNENAVIAGTGNNNTVDLTYGDTYTTTEAKVTTYTYEAQVVKTDASNVVLTGAEFKLYDADKNEIKLKTATDGSYVIDTAADAAGVVITAGTATIKGLANGTYYIEETKAPDGYNELDEMQSFTISNANLDATVSGTSYTSGGVQVINQTGSILPSTGGIGTTIFYIAGAVLVLIAVAYFFYRRKSAVKEG